MATRAQCPSFNTSLERRTLETDDWLALLFLYNNLFVPSEYATINSAFNVAPSSTTVIIHQNYSLSQNTSVPSGVTLQINANLTVNLGTYSIISSGGTITVEEPVSGLDVKLKSGSSIVGLFPTIASALSSASSGQTVLVTGSQTISSNLSILSSITLAVNSGVTLTFGTNIKLSVNSGGTLSANGATFQGNGSPGSWHSISFYANSNGSVQYSTIRDAQCGVYSTTGASVTVSNNTITNNSLYGLSLIQNSNTTVSSNTISNNGTGISVSSSSVTLAGNDIQDNSNYGIYGNTISSSLHWYDNTIEGNGYAMVLNNASPYIYGNFISDNIHGVVMNSSLPSFAEPSGNWRG